MLRESKETLQCVGVYLTVFYGSLQNFQANNLTILKYVTAFEVSISHSSSVTAIPSELHGAETSLRSEDLLILVTKLFIFYGA